MSVAACDSRGAAALTAAMARSWPSINAPRMRASSQVSIPAVLASDVSVCRCSVLMRQLIPKHYHLSRRDWHLTAKSEHTFVSINKTTFTLVFFWYCRDHER